MIIIWSITYNQLYLIKAVISLRVSGNRGNRKSRTTRIPLWGCRPGTQKLGAAVRVPLPEPASSILEIRGGRVGSGWGPATESGTSQSLWMDSV